jgi:RNA polymerase sporulation-specific sigma factor
VDPEVAAVTIGIQDLALRARAGDQMALDELLSGGRGWIKSLCNRKGYFLLSGGDTEDLVQEGLIGLHKAVRTWDPEQSRFVPFAEMVVTRSLVTALKTVNRKKHNILNAAMSLDAPAHEAGYKGNDDRDRLELWELPDISGLSRDPAELVAAAEEPDTSDMVRVLLEGLSPLERQVVTRVCLAGQSYKAAAAAMGVQETVVDNALQRGKGKILRLAQQGGAREGLSEEAVFTLRRLAKLSEQAKAEQTDVDFRAALPVELLQPGVMGRYRRRSHTWLLPPDRLLALFPDIRDYAVGEKGPILEAYLLGHTCTEIDAMMGRSAGSVRHHLQRTIKAAAKAYGMRLESDGPELTPLQQRVDQLWRKGTTMREIYATLVYVATEKEIDAALASLRRRVYERTRFTQVESEVQTKRVPLVAPKRIPYLLGKVKPLLPEEYVLTLRLYMLGYSQQEIATRRGVAEATVGKTDLPVMRRRLAGIKGFEFLYSRHARERQSRVLWLEALGWTEQTALAMVPEQHREIISLWLQGYSEQEIADKVSVPATAIQGRLGHCRTILRRRPEAQRRDGRHGAGVEAVRARKAAARATTHADDLRRFRLYGHLLNAERRDLLTRFFAGQSVGDMAEAAGYEANDTTRGRMWARMELARKELVKLEQQAHAPVREAI